MLTTKEFIVLELLNERSGLVELENDSSVKFWKRMEDRGYCNMYSRSKIGFEIVKGDFIRISDAGKEALQWRKN